VSGEDTPDESTPAEALAPDIDDDIDGIYTARKMVHFGDEGSEEIEDCLEVDSREGGQLVFTFHTHSLLGEHCTLSGLARREDEGRFVWRHLEEEHQCTLVMVALGDRVVLEDDGASCAQLACKSGTFDGVGFNITTKRALGERECSRQL